MKIETLKEAGKISQAPRRGKLLAYTPKNVIFENYSSLSEAEDLLSNQDLLEVHLFDSISEYRAIASESSRASLGFIDCIVSDAVEADAVQYRESMFVSLEGSETLNTVNYLHTQDGTGVMYVSNYRFATREV